MTARSQDLDDLSGTNLHGSSLGSLGSGTASSANNHIQHAAQAVETHRQGADKLKRSATNCCYNPPPGSNPPLNPYSHEDEPESP